MNAELKSPRITHLSWGRLEVDGFPVFKDAKLYPGGAREWDWSISGTHHTPGIQMADVEELLEHGATVVILSKGMHEDLQTPAETLHALELRGVKVHLMQTKDAVEMYNQMREKDLVGALIHSTC